MKEKKNQLHKMATKRKQVNICKELKKGHGMGLEPYQYL